MAQILSQLQKLNATIQCCQLDMQADYATILSQNCLHTSKHCMSHIKGSSSPTPSKFADEEIADLQP